SKRHHIRSTSKRAMPASSRCLRAVTYGRAGRSDRCRKPAWCRPVRSRQPIETMARTGIVRTIYRGSFCLAVLLATGPEARAADCTATPTPACHLELGKKLLKTDPKRAAQELFASYKLDERTDTLELYASA